MSHDEQSSRASRAEARASWPVQTHRLGEEPSPNLLTTTTVEERLAMVWQITQDTWALAGRPIPQYERHETPVRMVTLGSDNPPGEG